MVARVWAVDACQHISISRMYAQAYIEIHTEVLFKPLDETVLFMTHSNEAEGEAHAPETEASRKAGINDQRSTNVINDVLGVMIWQRVFPKFGEKT